jgi:hypothetical protein
MRTTTGEGVSKREREEEYEAPTYVVLEKLCNIMTHDTGTKHRFHFKIEQVIFPLSEMSMYTMCH